MALVQGRAEKQMTQSHSADKLIETYTDLLLDLIREKSKTGPRTYGFEYEFLPETPLSPDHLDRLYAFLPRCGFYPEDGWFRHGQGISITFEPGGQIEYLSRPLLPEDTEAIEKALATIQHTNRAIKREWGLSYLAVGYLPGRGEAPLCLNSERYRLLHDRFGRSGARGREMMKGTASIHLHVVIRNLDEIAPLFVNLCEMSRSRLFGMSPERRDIWNKTDPGRCGLPYTGINRSSDPRQVIAEVVRVAVEADVVGEDRPFKELTNPGFDAFLYHLTTIFTDVRLNVKGPTMELRTPDSVPFPEFRMLWSQFVETLPQKE
ncbi:MAG: hypothetical protein K9L83_10740 [Deltaproteobacteria bacterium]|nr:hypothetical protein [Deltaproteobacteria bacterium]